MANNKVNDGFKGEVDDATAGTESGASEPAGRANSIPDISVTTLEADPNGGVETQVASNTSTLRSALSDADTAADDFRFQHGRRYHSARTGNYPLPNDEPEQGRLNLQHHIYRMALDGLLFQAPLPRERIRNVLDVGCGTGRWCVEVAKELPHARVEGIDLSPIQPKTAPANCIFSVQDANNPWPTREQNFDLIHTRAITLGIADWPKFFQQAFETLTPGGYIELQEYLGRGACINYKPDDAASERGGPLMLQFLNYMDQGMAKMGRSFTIAEKFNSMLQEAGFIDIDIRYQDWPIGPWAQGEKYKALGALMAENFIDGLRSAQALFTNFLGWTVEGHQELTEELAEDTWGGKWFTYTRIVFVFARKPE